MPQTCPQCGQKFDLLPADIALLKKIAPVIGGKTYPLPLPKICFNCDEKNRFSLRSEHTLFQRTCDLTGQKIISMYAPDLKIPVYSTAAFWSDQWDPLSYGRDFDFNRPFFDQWAELINQVPLLALANAETENAEYNNAIGRSKNCYLNAVVYDSENVYYSYYVTKSKDIYDSNNVDYSELCFECVNINRCYNSYYLFNSRDSSDCYFSSDLAGCKNCFFCTNLINKEYYILNKPYTREEYLSQLKSFKLGQYSAIQKLKTRFFQEIFPNRIVRALYQNNCENSLGNYLFDSKNAHYAFRSGRLQDCRYVRGVDLKDAMCTMGGVAERTYQAINIGYGSNFYLSKQITGGSDVYYSIQSYFTENIFGCSGLKKHKYCLLNKQYTKEQWLALIPKVIAHMQKTGEWGKPMPFALNHFCYNETLAHDYYPLTEPEAKKIGYKWRTKWYEPATSNLKLIQAADLPDDIKAVPDDILTQVIACAKSNKPFRLIAQELAFYRQHNLPLPRLHPNERYQERFSYGLPHHFWPRACAKCGQTVDSCYAPGRSEIVYCEECYLKEVY